MPCIDKLKKQMAQKEIPEPVVQAVFEGFEQLDDHISKKKKYAFFAQAMDRLDNLLPEEQRQDLLQSCACCLGGSREKVIKAFLQSIAGKDLTLAEKLEALRQTDFFGGFPTLQEDGTITNRIEYADGKGGYQCPCPNFHKEKQPAPISLTYCHCCAGHFKHHFQKALGVKLKSRVVSSPLESMGRKPCRFVHEVVE